MRYWLLKSEPSVYSLDDLARDGRAVWDGVRNYQARNFLREMRVDDLAFFYHSNAKPPGIVGLARVTRAGVVDPTQFDPESPYHDPKATPEAPRWHTVEVAFVRRFPRMVPLSTLREVFTPEELWILRRGNRLSVVPVPEGVARRILALAEGVAAVS